MHAACSPTVRVRFSAANFAPADSCNPVRISQTQVDQALLSLWDYLFALHEEHNAAPTQLHVGAARAHAVALFEPAYAPGDAGWPYVRTITFRSAPAPLTFVFAVEVVGDSTPLLFTVAQTGAAFRVA